VEQTIIAAYDRPVPRYTSYPTAAQFTSAVGSAEHVRWLNDLKGDFAALYLHVPFCRQLCWYCACHTMAMRSERTLERYSAALRHELRMLAAAAADLIVGSVQWGGGTPSQLGAAKLRKIGGDIKDHFDRRAGAEMSMEIDPRYCDADLVEAMAAIGVNRASLGVQDFDVAVQQAINRTQSFELTQSALRRLRAAGIARINIDLVYGLPRQTEASLARTLDQAIALDADRFAVFAYAHVPWMKLHQRLIDTDRLPQAAERAAMATLVAERLTAAGYAQVGLDHFARPGDALERATRDRTLRRSFQGYICDESAWVVGAGASAISSLPQGYSQNVVDVAGYMSAVEQGRFATVRGVAVDADDRLRADIIARLMCTYAADIDAICHRHGVAPRQFLETISGLDQLKQDGLVMVDRGHLEVTDLGRPLVRSVCAAFDRYYRGLEGRYSRGI
jgi:oxygen-independent coproporphyrinogen-3 oxidase